MGIIAWIVPGIVSALLGSRPVKIVFHGHSLSTFVDISTRITAIPGVAMLLIMRTGTGGRRPRPGIDAQAQVAGWARCGSSHRVP
ncbi:hypothetical protein [Frankia sp. Cas3]|uniref:hypothetical protein n=1 Tax=Frankia sp. Cas3 TaxID=3073926 RepID=UPI002AD27DB1|nr:hypothetical protein [Frankia sp. Cas3]